MANIRDHYWSVQDSSPSTQVFSSAVGAFVALADATYTAWVAAGNTATVIDTLANLYGVIADYVRGTFRRSLGYTAIGTVAAATYTLTNSQLNSVVYITPSFAGGVDLYLPQCNLPVSWPIGHPLRIYNIGMCDLRIRNAGGTLITTLPWQSGSQFYYCSLLLLDNQSTSGNWSVIAPAIPGDGAIVTQDRTETLRNKTLLNTCSAQLKDTLFTLQDDGDTSKQAKFQCSGISASTTRTFTFPNYDATFASLAGTETLTNKTLGNTNTVTLKDTLFTLQDDGDAAKQAQFQLSGITTGNTRVLTIPDASFTFGGLGLSQTWSGVNTFSNTTNSTSTITGAIVTSGGIGVAKGITVGDGMVLLKADGSTAFTLANASAANRLACNVEANGSFTFYDYGAGSATQGYNQYKGSPILGPGALATNATDGFPYIPTCAGAPTGTPTGATGRVAMVYDSTNNRLYIYNGAWRSAAFA